MIEALASAAVGFFLKQSAEAITKEIGKDVYKTTLEKLKGFFSYKFAGKPELTQAETEPTGLVKLVAEEAANDPTFKLELEKLVQQLQELNGKELCGGDSYQDVDSVANINVNGSVSGSNLSGRDSIVGNTVSGSSNTIGGDHRKSSFR